MFAPHAGAWIETSTNPVILFHPLFAPHAGAWIETSDANAIFKFEISSPLMRGRGLKLL